MFQNDTNEIAFAIIKVTQLNNNNDNNIDIVPKINQNSINKLKLKRYVMVSLL